MPTSYPAEFRRRAIALVRSGWSVTKTAHDLDVTTTIYNWVKQDRIDRGEIPGMSTKESKELVTARWIATCLPVTESLLTRTEFFSRP